MNKNISNEFNILNINDITDNTDLKNALELINTENIITDVNPLEQKKFIVDKNKDLNIKDFKDKSEYELDEISNQADKAFEELMNIAINTSGKACGDIASAANNFLNIKLNTKLAKMDNKLKIMNYELNKQKIEASMKKYDASEVEPENDGIIIIENN